MNTRFRRDYNFTELRHPDSPPVGDNPVHIGSVTLHRVVQPNSAYVPYDYEKENMPSILPDDGAEKVTTAVEESPSHEDVVTSAGVFKITRKIRSKRIREKFDRSLQNMQEIVFPRN